MRKMTRVAAGLAVFLMAAVAGCKEIPEYLTVSDTRITGCDKDRVPANLVIPKGITEIVPFVFMGCTSLETVTIPASVKTIDYGAFSGCENIKTVKYMGTLAQWCQIDNTSYYENVTITLSDVPDLRALKTLVIPDGVTSIGIRAFTRCKELTSVTIPDSVRTIGYQAFMDCTSLESVTIPAGVTEIETGAFVNCTSLKSVTIPETVTKIGGAFAECSLESVTIPSSVRSMGGGAFSCRNLKTVKYNGTKAQWRKISIDGTRLDPWAFLDGVTVHCSDGNIPANQY
ncbi:MAG: leucine-rich repeat domain-containing protein [Treponema sp.]|nr:leucine-rich repeat domain-containing protein [Treponema sp.]